MIELKAERLFVYPVKGCAGVKRAWLELDPKTGVLFDRIMALAVDERPAQGDGVFRRKQNFVVGMRWPEVVRLRPEMSFGPAPRLNGFRIATEQGESAISLDALPIAAAELAEGAVTPRLVAAYLGRNFADRDEPYASIINLDTLEAFAKYVGDPALAEPARWRCNIYVRAGFGAEYAWARDKEMLDVGGAAVRVEKLLGRCAMITAEPGMGRKDHPELLKALRDFEQKHGFEHPEERSPVMGVLATPLATTAVECSG